MSYHSLRILIWKHMKERTRRWSTLFWEIFCGILLFVCLVLLRYLLYSVTTKETAYLGNMTSLETSNILYWPNNTFTKILMNQVAESIYPSKRYYSSKKSTKWRTDNEIVFTNKTQMNKTQEFGILGFNNEKALKNYLQTIKTKYPVLFVNFVNKKYEDFPDNLNYSIGIVDEIDNEMKLESMYFHNFSTGNMIALAGLQWAIDKNFLQMLTGDPLSQSVYIDIIRILPQEVTMMHSFLILCTVIAPLPYFLSMSKKIVIEKRSGLLELIKMVGVKPTTVHASHLIESGFYGLVYAILASIALKISSTPVLPASNYLILCITLFLHLLSVTSMSFVTSTLSQDYQHSDSAALLFYMMIFLTVSVWHKSNVSKTSVYVVGIFLPHSPLFIFWDQIVYLEHVGVGAKFRNLFVKHDSHCSPIILIWIFFILQIFLIMILAWYLVLIRPGRYGVAAKWNFCFKRSYWKKRKKVNFHATVEKSKEILRDERFFENHPKKSEIAIKIMNVTKVFRAERRKPAVHALKSVSLDVSRGRITVLLGGNGAGKTTLMSIIAGMYSTTEGCVYVNGYDISSRFQEIRKDLGFCPQVNLIFDYLTVRENLIFFGKLKNVDRCLEEDAESIINRLNMQEWADHYSYQLSGGMKRCLQVAIALVGDTDVLVLDEPTSTMDAGMRHALWECLLVLRGVKTIFMSTTMMEEADALGDRIALLHNGKLKCYGSPQFLKNAMGSETRLTVTVKYGEDTQKVQDLISQMIPNAGIIRQEDDRLHFRLDSEQSRLIKLLDTLEQQKQELNISNMEIGMSLEYVFLRFLTEEEDLNEFCDAASLKRIPDTRITGWSLWIQQVRVLMKRILLYHLSKKYQFFFLQIFLPLLGLMLVTIGSNDVHTYDIINRTTFDDISHDNIVLVNNLGHNRKTNIFNEIKRLYPNIEIVHSLHVLDDLKKEIKLRTDYLPKNIIGFEWEQNRSVILYPMTDHVSLSRDINLYSNVYKALHLPFAKNLRIDTSYVAATNGPHFNESVSLPKTVVMSMIWSTTTAFFVTVPLAPLILLVIEEYNNSVRYCHVMTGCSSITIWSTKLLTHMVLYTCVVPFTVLVTAYCFDRDMTLDQPDFLGAVFLCLFLFGPAFLVHMYVLSFFLERDHAISQLYILTLCFALISPTVIFLIGAFSRAISFLLQGVGNIFPPLNLSICISMLTMMARKNSYCIQNRALCPNLPISILYQKGDVETCCASNNSSPFGYYLDDDLGILYNLLVFVIQFIFYAVLLKWLQDRRAQNWWGKLLNQMYRKPVKYFHDAQVIEQEEYVANKMAAFHKKSLAEKREILGDDVLLVRDLHKVYYSGCVKRCKAVRGISFALKKGECLGILGPNGAGKTTTLGMIAGRTCMTRGNANAQGYFIRQNRREYLCKFGFMRAVFGLDAFMTGFDNLVLISMLYGRSQMLSEKFALQWMQFMGLSSLCHVLTDRYSMGCSRRLAVCSALIICPRVAMFDEPTSSVDAHTRPLVARAVHYALESGTACIVAEGSMSWRHMDSVCNRIGLMIRGQFAAIDSAQAFRKHHASGYTVIFKLAVDSTVAAVVPVTAPSLSTILSSNNLSIGSEVDTFKQDFTTKFENSVLLDEHLNILHYHIKEDKSYSEMFVYLEEMKSTYACIENYTLSETSIEEVYCKLQNKHMSLSKTDVER